MTLVAIIGRYFLNGEDCMVVEPGNQVKGFTHGNDIVSGLMLARDLSKMKSGCFGPKNMKIIELSELFGE